MEITLSLSKGSGEPLYKQLSDALRDQIIAGNLKPGERLTSIRTLAKQLSLSVETVSLAYEHVTSQGFAKTIVGTGTFVSDLAKKPSAVKRAELSLRHVELLPTTELSDYGKELLSINRGGDLATPFSVPALETLPLARWREMLTRSARFADHDLLEREGDQFGYGPLREAIASYLLRARSLQCSKDQIVFFHSTESGIGLMARLFLNRGDFACVENPGFIEPRQIFAAHNAHVFPVPVDINGIIVDELKKCPGVPKIIYVTPARHDPTGAAMSQSRRTNLLAWAKETNAFIIEDDFDSEYFYGERAAPALASQDENECVIYRYNFWQLMFPLVRVGFMVLPLRLVELVKRAKAEFDCCYPLLDQRALADFLNEGHLERHVRKMRPILAARRKTLTTALVDFFGDRVTIVSSKSGTHLLLQFPATIPEQTLLEHAKAADLALRSTRTYYVDRPKEGQFTISFDWSGAHDLRAAVKDFASRLACS